MAAAILLAATGLMSGQKISLQLPTNNDALFRGDWEAFFMPTNLTGRSAESGSWGFVRNLRTFEEGRVYTRFHEGLDIRPVHRNSSKIPTDQVKAVSAGRVAYVNPSATRSNYGKYVVVEHNWGYGPFFSLYAHMASTSVEAGQQVQAGSVLGVLGSTGRGLNNARAHLHLELNIMMNDDFNSWMKHYLNSSNPHGNHNGINLSGIDMKDLYLRLQQNPKLRLDKMIHAFPQHYRVTVPRSGTGPLPIVRRYRWMGFGNHKKPSESWEIALTRSGFPVGIAPSSRKVTEPTVTYVKSSRIDHKHYTIGRLTGVGSDATLTASGKRFIALITDEFPKGD